MSTGINIATRLPYKVFTALLTQSGEGNQQDITGGDLTIGVTYRIVDQAGGTWDFTNVGAPNNNIDTYFVATGTTPNSWGNGTLIYNTGAPVATVLENTIGNIWFTYAEIGTYAVNSNGLFIEDKTTIDIDSFGNSGDTSSLISNSTTNDGGRFRIYTDKEGFSDNVLQKNRLEIRVYN